MAKKRASLRKPKAKMNKTLIVALAVIVVAAIAVAIYLQMQPVQPIVPNVPYGQGNNYVVTSTGEGCRTNTNCFEVNCKSTPTDVKCVNATAQSVYYVNCGNIPTNVNVATQDFTKCACVQGTCQMIA